MQITVIRRIPAPIIGTCGVLHDRAFESFEETLDWLEVNGCVPVTRIDSANSAALQLLPQAIRDVLTADPGALPLVLVDTEVLARGTYPTRTQLAEWVGHRAHCALGS